jgi:curved DNA-binding protein CbpA
MVAATEPDPYTVLGVSRDATDAQIRTAYRALAARYHPDRHQGNPLSDLATEKLAALNRAYEILSDPARRVAYDVGGTGSFGARRYGGGAGGGGAGAGPTADADPAQRARAGRRVIQVMAVLTILPLLLRFGRLIGGALAAFGRETIELFAMVRGTPFAAITVLVAAALLVAAFVRRRRRRQRTTRPRQS